MSTVLGVVATCGHEVGLNNEKGSLAPLQATSLVDDEATARKKAASNPFYLLLVNGYAAIFIFVFHLISLEGLVSIGLSVGFTVYVFNITEGNDSFNGSAMTWVLLSFAVITPIGAALRMAFSRRELALQQTALLRSTFLELYASHAIWDWGFTAGNELESGRTKSKVDWLEHSDAVCKEILGVCKEVTRLLTLPSATRARHKTTGSGKKEAQRTTAVNKRLMESIVTRFGQLAMLCEILKREGLPPNEATRVRQWERRLLEAIEKLRVIKIYRSPQGLRSFARLFSIFLPPFYAPYYAQLAHDLNSLGTAIVFSIITSLALTSLFETISQMEDPFVVMSVLDGVNVKRELLDDFTPQLLTLRQCFFPSSSNFEGVDS